MNSAAVVAAGIGAFAAPLDDALVDKSQAGSVDKAAGVPARLDAKLVAVAVVLDVAAAAAAVPKSPAVRLVV